MYLESRNKLQNTASRISQNSKKESESEYESEYESEEDAQEMDVQPTGKIQKSIPPESRTPSESSYESSSDVIPEPESPKFAHSATPQFEEKKELDNSSDSSSSSGSSNSSGTPQPIKTESFVVQTKNERPEMLIDQNSAISSVDGPIKNSEFTFEKNSLEQFEKIVNLDRNIKSSIASSELEQEDIIQNLDEDQILFEDKKSELKSIVKKQKLQKEIQVNQKNMDIMIKQREIASKNFMDRVNADKPRIDSSKIAMPEDEYNQVVDGINEKCNFVMACFDTVYFLNEDKRQEQLELLLRNKAIQKIAKGDSKTPYQKARAASTEEVKPVKANKEKFPFKTKSQHIDNPFFEAKYLKINVAASIKSSGHRSSRLEEQSMEEDQSDSSSEQPNHLKTDQIDPSAIQNLELEVPNLLDNPATQLTSLEVLEKAFTHITLSAPDSVTTLIPNIEPIVQQSLASSEALELTIDMEDKLDLKRKSKGNDNQRYVSTSSIKSQIQRVSYQSQVKSSGKVSQRIEEYSEQMSDDKVVLKLQQKQISQKISVESPLINKSQIIIQSSEDLQSLNEQSEIIIQQTNQQVIPMLNQPSEKVLSSQQLRNSSCSVHIMSDAEESKSSQVLSLDDRNNEAENYQPEQEYENNQPDNYSENEEPERDSRNNETENQSRNNETEHVSRNNETENQSRNSETENFSENNQPLHIFNNDQPDEHNEPDHLSEHPEPYNFSENQEPVYNDPVHLSENNYPNQLSENNEPTHFSETNFPNPENSEPNPIDDFDPDQTNEPSEEYTTENLIIQNTQSPCPYEPPSQKEISTLHILAKNAVVIKKSKKTVVSRNKLNTCQASDYLNSNLKAKTIVTRTQSQLRIRNSSKKLVYKSRKGLQEIYYKDNFNLSREMINQDAVIQNINKLDRSQIGSQWTSIMKNLQQNPQKVMTIIPTPRVPKIMAKQFKSIKPKTQNNQVRSLVNLEKVMTNLKNSRNTVLENRGVLNQTFFKENNPKAQTQLNYLSKLRNRSVQQYRSISSGQKQKKFIDTYATINCYTNKSNSDHKFNSKKSSSAGSGNIKSRKCQSSIRIKKMDTFQPYKTNQFQTQSFLPKYLESSLSRLEKHATIAQNQSQQIKQIVNDIRSKNMTTTHYKGSVNNLLKKLSMKNKMMEHIYASRKSEKVVDWQRTRLFITLRPFNISENPLIFTKDQLNYQITKLQFGKNDIALEPIFMKGLQTLLQIFQELHISRNFWQSIVSKFENIDRFNTLGLLQQIEPFFQIHQQMINVFQNIKQRRIMVQQIQYELENEVILQDLVNIEKKTEDTAQMIKMLIVNDKRRMVFPTQKFIFGGRQDFVAFMFKQIRDIKSQIDERQVQMFDQAEPLG